MELTQNLDDRDLPTRTLLTVGLAVFALWSLLRGKRLRGVLAGLGAVALGYSASTESGDVMDRLAEGLDVEPARKEDERLRCAICGDPVVAGQPRRPNEDGETVHQACLEAAA